MAGAQCVCLCFAAQGTIQCSDHEVLPSYRDAAVLEAPNVISGYLTEPLCRRMRSLQHYTQWFIAICTGKDEIRSAKIVTEGVFHSLAVSGIGGVEINSACAYQLWIR